MGTDNGSPPSPRPVPPAPGVVRVQFAATPEEKARIGAAAFSCGLSRATFVRLALTMLLSGEPVSLADVRAAADGLHEEYLGSRKARPPDPKG